MKDLVTVTCYNRTEQLERKEALSKYFECMLCSEGCERERYTKVYLELKSGLKECSDGV